MEFLPLPVTMMMCSIPDATHSSATYWICALSTTVSISLGCAFVAGKKRVPSPAAGSTALRTLRRGAPSCGICFESCVIVWLPIEFATHLNSKVEKFRLRTVAVAADTCQSNVKCISPQLAKYQLLSIAFRAHVAIATMTQTPASQGRTLLIGAAAFGTAAR